MEELDMYTEQRPFDCENYLKEKIENINEYLKLYNIEGVVLGVSGGIDSALTYKLLEKVKELGQLKKIIPVFIGFVEPDSGISGQYEALEMATLLVADNQDYKHLLVTNSNLQSTLLRAQFYGVNPRIEDYRWASGQMNYMLRTPIFYQVASSYQTLGVKTIVCGTTNKSEGSFIGYFGKFSDMAVDIQIISDLYKSEVFLLAKHLDVPQQIIDRTPKGDVVDGLTDEELMGFKYDELELFLRERESNPDITSELSLLPKEVYDAIIKHNHKNIHKYMGGYQAVFIINNDIKIKGGWNLNKFDIKNYKYD